MKSRKCRSLITLTRATAVVDAYGHASVGESVPVLDLYADVSQMGASRTMITFQQADIVGLEIVFRKPETDFNGIRWNGHDVHFSVAEDIGNRGRWLRVTGYYQIDDPGL